MSDTDENEPPPDCDQCSTPAHYWCDSCSVLICKTHFDEHKDHEVAPLEDDENENEDDNDHEEETITSSASSSAAATSTASSSSSVISKLTKDTEIDLSKMDSEDENAMIVDNKKHKINKQALNISEEKFCNVLSMLEDSPQTVCRRLFMNKKLGVINSDESTSFLKYNSDHDDDNFIQSLLSSVYQNSFVVIDGFPISPVAAEVEKGKDSINKHFKLSPSHNQQQLGQRGDFVCSSSVSRQSLLISKRIEDEIGRKILQEKGGLRIFENNNNNNNNDDTSPETELWKFVVSSSSSERRNFFKDSVPNDGRLGALKGILGRRISVVLFLKSNDDNILQHQDESCSSSSFVWKLKVLNGMSSPTVEKIEAKKGRMIIFMSGAVETQVVDVVNEQDDDNENENDDDDDDDKTTKEKARNGELFALATWFR